MAARFVAEARGGGRPRFIHAQTWRVKGHVSVDTQGYRAPGDIEAARAADPLALARERLLARGTAAAALDAVLADARAEIDAALRFADESPAPATAAAYTDVQTLGAGVWR
ncbi:MAG: thiamine pyrophosphate-dependent enzyme [Rubrivivax sp.]